MATFVISFKVHNLIVKLNVWNDYYKSSELYFYFNRIWTRKLREMVQYNKLNVHNFLQIVVK